jgi:glycosyltransferase involved in cell wall biosynthesis
VRVRVLFLSDPLFTRHEVEMISRLAVGLADEGFSVAWGVPEVLATGLNEQVLTPVVPYIERRLGLSPARRAASLREAADAVLGGDPDIVHFFGGGVNRIGAETARLAGALPAFEVWRPGLEGAIRLAVNRVHGGGGEESRGARALLVAPTDDARDRLNAAFPEAVARTIPWGVFPSGEDRDGDGGTMCLVLLGPGRDGRSWQAAFRAALRSLQGSERLHLFADAETTRRLRLWPVARQAGVLDRLSLFDQAGSTRELMLRADLVMQPDARGETRTVVLDAMGAGVAVLAASDPRSDLLIDSTTARLVVDQTEQQWFESIEMLVQDGGLRRRLTDSARDFVRTNHKASRQIASLVDAYEWIGGEAERIEAPPVLGPGPV